MSTDEWIKNASDDELTKKRTEYALKRFSFSGTRDSDIVNKLIADLDAEMKIRGLT